MKKFFVLKRLRPNGAAHWTMLVPVHQAQHTMKSGLALKFPFAEPPKAMVV